MATAPVFEGLAHLVVDVDRMRCGLATFEEDEVLGVEIAVAGNVRAVGDEVGVEAGDHGDSRGGVDVSGDDGIEVPDGEPGVEGGGSGVLRIDRPDDSREVHLPVAGQRGADRKGKTVGKGEVV